jgi:hypothetical protein
VSTLIQEGRPRSRARVAWRRASIVLVGLGIAAALVLWTCNRGEEQRTVSRLPVDERAAIYAREIAAFETLCGEQPRRDALEERCRERAAFLVKFPECDARCRALARSHSQPPRPIK